MSVSDYNLIQSLHVDDDSSDEPEIVIKPQLEDITETKDRHGNITTRRTAERLKSKIEKKKHTGFAILIRRRITPDKEVVWVRMEVSSLAILEALTKICGDSFFLNTKVTPMVIEKPYLVLFHYRNELREYSTHPDRSDEEKLHVKILIDFMAREFDRLEVEYNQYIPNSQVTFTILWTLFKPHDEVFVHHGDYVTCGVVCDIQYIGGACSVGTRSWDYDGTFYGPVYSRKTIDYFEGICDITSLPLYPVRYHKSKDKKDLRERLIERGRKWKRMLAVTHCKYKGKYPHNFSAHRSNGSRCRLD